MSSIRRRRWLRCDAGRGTAETEPHRREQNLTAEDAEEDVRLLPPSSSSGVNSSAGGRSVEVAEDLEYENVPLRPLRLIFFRDFFSRPDCMALHRPLPSATCRPSRG